MCLARFEAARSTADESSVHVYMRERERCTYMHVHACLTSEYVKLEHSLDICFEMSLTSNDIFQCVGIYTMLRRVVFLFDVSFKVAQRLVKLSESRNIGSC